jgi:hypothetical protein
VLGKGFAGKLAALIGVEDFGQRITPATLRPEAVFFGAAPHPHTFRTHPTRKSGCAYQAVAEAERRLLEKANRMCAILSPNGEQLNNSMFCNR